MPSEETNIQSTVEEATFDFTMGDAASAIAKLTQALERHPDSFEGWHALAEIHFSEKRFKEALAAGERAHALRPHDVFINTSLSRIWLENGSKEKAEHFGAQARMADWKSQIKNPEASSSGKGLF